MIHCTNGGKRIGCQGKKAKAPMFAKIVPNEIIILDGFIDGSNRASISYNKTRVLLGTCQDHLL